MCWGYGHTPPCWAELQVCDSTAQEGLKLCEGNHKNTVEKPGWAVGLLSLALLLTDSPALSSQLVTLLCSASPGLLVPLPHLSKGAMFHSPTPPPRTRVVGNSREGCCVPGTQGVSHTPQSHQTPVPELRASGEIRLGRGDLFRRFQTAKY